MKHVSLMLAVCLVTAFGLSAHVFGTAIGNPNANNGWNATIADAVGSPGLANGWSSTSAVSVSAFSSEKVGRPWVRTIDGSGLDAETGLLMDNSHNSTGNSQSWNTETGTWEDPLWQYVYHISTPATSTWPEMPTDHWLWVEYEFDQVYNLGEMRIWNCNELNWPFQGLHEITINISETGAVGEWTTIYDGNVPIAPSQPDATHQIDVDFDGAAVKYVVIIADPISGLCLGDPGADNSGNWFWNSGTYCLDTHHKEIVISEVRFNFEAPITATASSTSQSLNAGGQLRSTPAHTIDGSGIDPNEPNAPPEILALEGNGMVHTSDIFDTMWASYFLADSAANPNPGTVAGSHWIRYDFDQAYDLSKMLIWNYNEWNYQQWGMKEVTIEYSPTGGTGDWVTIYDGNIPIASGTQHLRDDGDSGTSSPTYDLQVDFGGVSAKSVVITTDLGAEKNWESDKPDPNEFVGLSEVRIFTVPTNCAEVIADGYNVPGDANADCYVDILDIKAIAEDWLKCVEPDDMSCQFPW